MAQPKKPTKDPLPLRVVRFTFGILDKIAPPLANRWGFKLFITPFRYPLPERERIQKAKAEEFSFNYDGCKLNAYKWGEGPIVLFMHGWAGRGLQCSEMVQPLVDLGYQVVTFDAQAHGKSEGKTTNLILMAGAMRTLINQLGPIHTLVGHSLGGAVGLYSITQGLEVDRIITISTPTVGQDIIDEYLRRINGSARVGRYLRKRIMEMTGKSFDDFTAETTARSLPKSVDYLIIHDKDDPEAPINHAEIVAKAAPHAKTFYTETLGHTRILRNPAVVERITSFVHQQETVPA